MATVVIPTDDRGPKFAEGPAREAPTPKIIDPLRLCPPGAEAFHAVLDADPGNQAVRALLADWLEERGEPWAAGLRWLVCNDRRPEADGIGYWDWWWNGDDYPKAALGKALYDSSRKWAYDSGSGTSEHVYDSRLEAEAWLCAYFEAAGVPESA